MECRGLRLRLREKNREEGGEDSGRWAVGVLDAGFDLPQLGDVDRPKVGRLPGKIVTVAKPHTP